jgi:hypothetical protein
VKCTRCHKDFRVVELVDAASAYPRCLPCVGKQRTEAIRKAEEHRRADMLDTVERVLSRAPAGSSKRTPAEELQRQMRCAKINVQTLGWWKWNADDEAAFLAGRGAWGRRVAERFSQAGR